MAGVSGPQMKRMLHSGHYADFKIGCDGAIFAVHKMILASASEFFRAMFEAGFKESEEGFASFPEDDPQAMGTILHYLYTGEYLLEPTEDFVKWMASTTSKTWAVADAKSPANKASQGKSSTSQAPSETIRRHILAYQTADKLNIQPVKEKIYKFFTARGPTALVTDGDLAQQLNLLYNVTIMGEDELRMYVTQQCVLHSSSLLSRPDVVSVMMKHEPTAWLIGTTYQSELEELKSKQGFLVRTLNSKNVALSRAESQEDTLSQRVDDLDQAKESLTTENETLKSENSKLRGQIGKLKGKNKRISKVCNDTRRQVVQLQGDVANGAARLNALQESLRQQYTPVQFAPPVWHYSR